MNNDSFNEVEFREKVRPHIQRCRDGDWNHAKRVVKWIKKLGKEREDLYLLITAGYIHDIGWRDVLPPQKLIFEKLLQYEKTANKNTKPYVTGLLEELEYSDEEIKKVLRLIKAADEHHSGLYDETIIVDADNLSKLDIDHLKEMFQKEEWMKLYKLWNKEFESRIKTEQGKKAYPKLLENLRKEIENE